MKLCFQLASRGDALVQTLEAPGGVVGRVVGSSLCIPDGVVSSRHAEIVFKDDQWTIRDLQSTNGTFLDDQRLGPAEVPLPSRGQLRLGTVLLSFWTVTAEPAPKLGPLRLTNLHQLPTLVQQRPSSVTPVTVIRPAAPSSRSVPPPLPLESLAVSDTPVTMIRPKSKAEVVDKDTADLPAEMARLRQENSDLRALLGRLGQSVDEFVKIFNELRSALPDEDPRSSLLWDARMRLSDLRNLLKDG